MSVISFFLVMPAKLLAHGGQDAVGEIRAIA
jgi:hypothetical protein